MKNLLFISISAPPKTGAESIQTSRFIKYLSKYFRITLITTPANTKGWEKKDISFREYGKFIHNRIEIKNFYWLISRLYRIKFLKNRIIFPDTHFLFHIFWKKIKRIEGTDFDLIYSRSVPFSSAILAYKLKKQFQIPWIAHFSDPWYGNPYYEYSDRFNKKIRYWEKEIVNYADGVHLTSKTAVELYKKRYPQKKSKFKFSPNVYDPDYTNSGSSVWNSKLTIAYIGNLYGSRNILPIVGALNYIKENKPQQFKKIEFIIAGHIDQFNLRIINESQFPNLNYRGHVEFERSIQIMNTADILVAIDKKYESPIDLVFFPSKLMDYYSTGKFILGIAHPDSPTCNFINKIGGRCFNHDDYDETGKYIAYLVDEYKLKNEQIFVNRSMDYFFSAENQAAIFNERSKFYIS